MACALSCTGGHTPGTYKASAQGNNGPVEVSVTSERHHRCGGRPRRNPGHRDRPISEIPAAIVENQSLNIDTVSGATNTSKAILSAVEDCVVQAGGDAEALKQAEVSREAAEDVEASYDVVIVGGGGAGLSAAVAASQAGASAVIVEKAGALGGNSLLAGGAFNACDPEEQAKVEMSESLLHELESYLALDEADFGEFADTLKTVKAQIMEYLAGDTSKVFDSPELHMLHIYLGGKRTGLDGTVIVPELALADTLAHGAGRAQMGGDAGVEWRDNISTVLGAMARTHGVANGKITLTWKGRPGGRRDHHDRHPRHRAYA